MAATMQPKPYPLFKRAHKKEAMHSWSYSLDFFDHAFACEVG